MKQVSDLVWGLFCGGVLTLLLVRTIACAKKWRGSDSREAGANRKITFSHRLYLVVPRHELVWVSLGLENVQSIKVSIDEAREVFRIVERCCVDRELREANVGELAWK